ncbi:MAG TPA: hypothetical protein VJQ52_00065 [Steroidobacteraceae bacterium]|nr:hypothetical protein [Steroidobacteraceae bacterium]
MHESRLFAPGFFIDPQWGARLDSLRTAIVKHRHVEFEYRDGHAPDSQRRVRPFGRARPPLRRLHEAHDGELTTQNKGTFIISETMNVPFSASTELAAHRCDYRSSLR